MKIYVNDLYIYIYIYIQVFVYLIFISPFSIYEYQIVSVQIISRLIYYCGKMHELCCNVIKYYLRRYPGDVMWYTCTLLLDPRQIIIHLSFDISLHLVRNFQLVFPFTFTFTFFCCCEL